MLHAKAELPGWLVDRTRRRLTPYGLGIQIRDETSIPYLFPPKEVVEAFDKVTQAQTEISTTRNKAEQDAQETIRKAEADRFDRVQLAEGSARQQRLLAQADADRFERRQAQYQRLRRDNPDFLAGIWWDSMGVVFAQLRDQGRIDLIDNHVGGDGLDIIQFPPSPKRR
jgi:regulator of protease activity HflC (stomatin/prohibitin superfamily)